LNTALAVAKTMPEDSMDFNIFKNTQYPNFLSYDLEGLKTPLAQKIELAKQLELQCKKTDSRIKGIRSASISENEFETHMMDQEQNQISYKKTMYTAQMTCKAEDRGDSQIGFDSEFSTTLNKLDISKVATQAAQNATRLLGAKNAPTLQCAAVFENQASAELLELLAASFSEEEIFKGKSLFNTKKLKDHVFSSKLTIFDNPLLSDGYASVPFDDEGVCTQTKELIKDGTLNSTLNNLYYAMKNKVKPTGNSFRALKSPPKIQSTNIYFKSGNKSSKDLCASIHKGVLITDLMGLHTANPITGDFSLGASGFLIENGKILWPIKGFAVSGNLLTLLNQIEDIGNDLKFFGPIGATSFSVKAVSIGGT
ncbi:MAG: TldD/PmbA family protein, partial [Bdellovibrio sp.]|nr:TldD/PmbA family protein [Bdellovibrio sp.]